jgi:predicted HAD superfamily phosphohydrolase YqeG
MQNTLIQNSSLGCSGLTESEIFPGVAPPPTIVVFDMDNTLLAFDTDKFTVRPHAVDVILELWAIPHVYVVLWSAGSKDYVDNMVDVVLLPAIQAKNPLFWFSNILTYEETDCGMKDLNKVCKMYEVPRDNVVLVDDSIAQCSVNISNGFQAIMVPPYDPKNKEDQSLLGIREKIHI